VEDAKPISEPTLIDGLWWSREADGTPVRWDEAREAWMRAEKPPPVPGFGAPPPKRRRRRPPGWLLAWLLIVAAIETFVVADRFSLHWYYTEAPVEHDQVVGVVRKCDANPSMGATQLAVKIIGLIVVNGCEYAAGRYPGQVINDRLELTIRTASGATYNVTTSRDANVTVGITWPP
jgi:hypothetical protein